MELGSVTLKRIGFFCFPIKRSTHTQRGLRCKTRGDRHETQETLSILCPKLHSRQDVALAALLSQMRSGSLHQSRYGKDIVAHWSVQSAAHLTYVRSWRLGSGAPLRMPAKALFATCPVSLCPTTELFYSSIEQGSDTELSFGTS